MKQITRWSLLVLVIFALFVIVSILAIDLTTRHYRSPNINDFSNKKVAIVFGARIYRNGDPSPFLRDRVEGGAKLLQQGKVEKILMSGDNHIEGYDEVSAMRKYAIELGVPADKIVLDYAGFSTYETCYRAKEIFGVSNAILVSQAYHLSRAVYTCRTLGIDATGFEQPDWERYHDVMIRNVAREYLAKAKMYIDLYITKPDPTYLGKKEYIN